MLSDSQTSTDGLPALKPVVAPRDVVELEVYFVDRRIGDPLIMEGLWSNLYPVTSLSPETREQLQTDGLKLAMASSRPSRQLQSLIRLSNDSDPSRRVRMQKQVIFSGQDACVFVSEVPNGTPLCSSREGKELELTQGICQLRLAAERVEDRWARIVITPEIRHGANSLRPVATTDEWRYEQGQPLLSFYEDRMSADLNLGEILVLGLDNEKPKSLASHFFRSDISTGIERLLVIRLSNMQRIEPVRAQ